MICPGCGNTTGEDSPFCSNCGAALGPSTPSDEHIARAAPQTQPPASPPPPQAGVLPPLSPPAQASGAYPPPAPGTKPKRNRTPLLIAVIGVLVVAAVVVVLVFTVFKGDKNGGSGTPEGMSDPAVAVDVFFRAIEDGDVDSLVTAIDPEYIDEFKAEFGQEYKGLLEEFFLATNPEELEIKGLEFEVEENGDEAVVRVVAGTASYLDANGEKVSEDVNENVLTDFEVVKIGGQWYVSMSTFPDWWYYLNSVTGDGS